MCRTAILGSLTLAIGCFVATVHGEQQVQLQSGATLVGEVTLSGPNLVVEIGGAKLEVPFKEVASVTPVANVESKLAADLLLRGLESRLLSAEENKDAGLLAEAFRLAPQDPHVSFWHARSLLIAGKGKEARDVFEPHREAIVAAYAGNAELLAKQIEERLALEKLPPRLVSRLDHFAVAARQASPIAAEKTAYAAYFRLVDQADEPVAKADFRVSCNGEDEKLESFGGGYHLATYARRNNFGHNPCRLELLKLELVGDVVEFNGGAQVAENVGVIRVQRLGDEDRRPVVMHVVDSAGKPLAGAAIALSAANRSSSQDGTTSATTNAEGTARLRLFPNEYVCSVNRRDYCPGSQHVVVGTDEKQTASVEVKLYRTRSAAIQVAWRSKVGNQPRMSPFPNGAVTMGEFEQQIGSGGEGGFAAGRNGPAWVRLVQDGNEVQVVFAEQMGFPHAEVSWVGRWRRAAERATAGAEIAEDDTELFEMLDLSQLDLIKDQLKLERTNFGQLAGGGSSVSLPVEVGDIYVGRINAQDPQTGRPAIIEFKILASELSRP